MISNLCGTRVRFTAYPASDPAEGVGVIRAVYPDQRENRVARVIVEVLEVHAGPVSVGDLADLCVNEVSTDLARGVGATKIVDCSPQFSTRAELALVGSGLTTLAELAALTPAELLRRRNVGRKVLHEVELVLAAHGLSMRSGS